MSGLEGKATFECVEGSFAFNRCLRQGSVEAPRLWQKMAMQLLANVEEDWVRKRMGVLLDFEGEKAHQICSFIVGRQLLDHVPLPNKFGTDATEVRRWDLAPKPASLWWTSTYEPEEKCDLSIDTTSVCHSFSIEEKFKILGCAVNRQGKAHDAIEERMRSANKAFWIDFLMYKTKDIPWKIKCRRLVDHVLQSSPSKVRTGPGPKKTFERIKEWETKTMLRLFRFKKQKEKTWVDYYARTRRTARKIWVQIRLPFLYELIAESMWRAMGWVCDERSNAVNDTLKKV